MPNAKILSEKQAIVAELTEKLKGAVSGVLVDYKGITVAQDTALRSELRKNDVDYSVVKNTLVHFAAKNVGLDGLDEVLNGPSAFAFGMNDPVSPAKIINDFIVKKKSEAIEIKAGLLGNELMSMEQIKALAEMPSREVLLARLVGSLQSSIASFVRVLDAIARKDSEAAPAAAPEA